MITYAYYGHWLIYGASELVILALPAAALRFHENNFAVLNRIFRFALLVLLLGVALGRRIFPRRKASFDEENAPLLDPENLSSENVDGTQPLSNGTGYGSCNSDSNAANRPISKPCKAVNGKATDTKKSNGADEVGKKGFQASTKDLKVRSPSYCTNLTVLTIYSYLFHSSGLRSGGIFSCFMSVLRLAW